MKAWKLYVDTPVFGGHFDPEFAPEIRRFSELVKKGGVAVMIRDVVFRELEDAPEKVREVLRSIPPHALLPVDRTAEVLGLRDAYVETAIVGVRYVNDATNVAPATVARADAIVSWNFKRIVRADKMRAYDPVNVRRGFGLLSIVSPQEVRLEETA